jgi:DNA-binding response OmpR family regulator
VKLLLVEDDTKIRALLREALTEDGHETVEASTAEEALVIAEQGRIDGYVLDVLLPGLSGFELCQKIRDLGVKVPILMLSAKGGLSDKLEGLDSGADDYLTKPFELAEVKARLRALQRKVEGYPRPVLEVGDLVLDPNQKTVQRGGRELELSPKQFALLEYLVRNKNRLVTRAMIGRAVWEAESSIYTNVIDVFINYLRKRVDLEGLPRLIHTVRGKGFMVSDSPKPNQGDAVDEA